MNERGGADVQLPEKGLCLKISLEVFLLYDGYIMNEQPTSQSVPIKIKKSHRAIKITALITLLIAVIGSITYSVYAWQKNETLSSSVSDKNSQISKLNDELSLLKPGLKTESKVNTVTIKELGISVTVPDSIKDITYSYKSYKSSGSVRETVKFSTKTLTDTYASTAECTSFGSAPPLGELSKIVGDYPKEPNVDNTPGRLVKQFNGYYVAYSSPQSVCANAQTSVPAGLNVFIESLSTVKEL